MLRVMKLSAVEKLTLMPQILRGNGSTVGLAALQDAETGRVRVYDTGSEPFRRAVAEADANRVDRLRTGLRRRGIDFVHIDAATPVVEPLIAFFRMREKRIRR